MAYIPTDICQQAIDSAGIEYLLGDLEDGSRPAQVCLRAYRECLKQLLRGANWAFARKTIQLQLLADATGNTPNVGTIVPVPWVYEYALPPDCVKVRFIPWNQPQQNPGIPPGNITPPNPGSPIVTGLGNPQVGTGFVRPARFVIATDANYLPANPGYDTPGMSPEGQTVILTNVQNAFLVYTALMDYPSVWDPLFRSALVAYISSEIALPLSQDKKFGIAIRQQQIVLAKSKIEQARIRDGNEGFYSSNLAVDWMRARWTGGAGGWGNNWGDGGGPAVPWGGWGWDSVSFGDGTAY
jgi:hypothetical protein